MTCLMSCKIGWSRSFFLTNSSICWVWLRQARRCCPRTQQFGAVMIFLTSQNCKLSHSLPKFHFPAPWTIFWIMSMTHGWSWGPLHRFHLWILSNQHLTAQLNSESGHLQINQEMRKKCQPNAKMCEVNRVSQNYGSGSPTGVSMMLTSLFWTFTHHVTVSTAAPICCGTFCGLTNSAWITGCSRTPRHWHFRSAVWQCSNYWRLPAITMNSIFMNFAVSKHETQMVSNSTVVFQFLWSQSVGRATAEGPRRSKSPPRPPRWCVGKHQQMIQQKACASTGTIIDNQSKQNCVCWSRLIKKLGRSMWIVQPYKPIFVIFCCILWSNFFFLQMELHLFQRDGGECNAKLTSLRKGHWDWEETNSWLPPKHAWLIPQTCAQFFSR